MWQRSEFRGQRFVLVLVLVLLLELVLGFGMEELVPAYFVG